MTAHAGCVFQAARAQFGPKQGRKPMPPSTVVTTTRLPLTLIRRGKVRDVYDWDGRVLLVATDRISAFDCVMQTGVPDKGKILTALSAFWFNWLKSHSPNHMIAVFNEGTVPEVLAAERATVAGRTMLCTRTDVIPIECVARGYLAGSGWAEYRQSGSVCGIRLPEGLRQCDELPEPIFTPATKAESGHDENISFERMRDLVGGDLARELRNRTLDIYRAAATHAESKGILIADTKFEFGHDADGRLLLIDEVLTPDSSRFWPADEYEPGHDQPSFDKQYLRNYLQALCDSGRWNKTPPAPDLPDEVVNGTRARYIEAFERLTGRGFETP